MPSNIIAVLLIGIIIGVVCCLIPVLIVNRFRIKSLTESIKSKSDGEMRLLQERYSSAGSELSKTKEELTRYQQLLSVSSNGAAASESQCLLYLRQISELKNDILIRERKIEEQNSNVIQLRSNLSESNTSLEFERKQSEEKIKLLNGAREQLTTEFKNIANVIFDEKTKSFTELSKFNLDLVLNPLRDQLGEFRRKVEEVYVNESKDRHALAEHIKILTDLNTQVSKDTLNLTRALKGENKTQGNWGEMILERALELSGLKKGSEYDTQVAYTDSDGNRLIPDVVVHLPDSKDIIIDSKVTLTAYERATNATEETLQEEALIAHVIAVKNHINQLSAKSYDSLNDIKTLDYVLMFMPIALIYCRNSKRSFII